VLSRQAPFQQVCLNLVFGTRWKMFARKLARRVFHGARITRVIHMLDPIRKFSSPPHSATDDDVTGTSCKSSMILESRRVLLASSDRTNFRCFLGVKNSVEVSANLILARGRAAGCLTVPHHAAKKHRGTRKHHARTRKEGKHARNGIGKGCRHCCCFSHRIVYGRVCEGAGS